MPTIQPFRYAEMTAFKERKEMINKINELIDVINQGGTTPSDIVILSRDGYYTMLVGEQ